MRSKILVLLLLVGASAPAQWTYPYVLFPNPNAPIPSWGTGGAFGACTAAANKTVATVNGTDSIKATDVEVWVSLSHTYASDLRITLSHAGVSVVLFDQHVATAQHEFGGIYGFNDEAASTIVASIIPNQTLLQPGDYQPQSPLSAFDGTSAAGPWTLEICDLVSGDTGTLITFTVVVTGATTVTVPFQYAQPLDDGGQFGCTPFTYVMNVPPGAGSVSYLQLALGLTHARAADLWMTLTHGNVSVTIASPNTPPANAILGDQYYFVDGAMSWDTALTFVPGGWAVPGDFYSPDSPFSAFDGVDASGPWFFTICDSVQNTYVGSVSYVALTYQTFGYRFDLLQPSGSSSIVLKNTGGAAGHAYLNAITLVPGSFPYGWFHGLDISMAELVAQINHGVPFAGVLDANGSATVTIPGPVPPNLPVQFTSVELTPLGMPVSSMWARSYTTAP